jgi:hypothetical protein
MWLYPPMFDDPRVPDVTDNDALADAIRTVLGRGEQRRPLYDREGSRP